MSGLAHARAMLAEQERREAARQRLRATMFAEQLAVHDDPQQFRAVHSGRRAGKSDMVPKSAALRALAALFGQVVIIGERTQKKAKELHWANLDRVVREHGLPLVPNGSEGSWATPWGSKILFWGLSDAGAVEALRGFATAAAYFDEVAGYSTLLPRLVDVIEPSLGTTSGPLTLCGTPSLTRAGYWFKICSGQVPGWSVKHWNLLQNPFFRAPGHASTAAYLAYVRERNQWTEHTARYRREYLGEFVDDASAAVYQYAEGPNSVAALPAHYDRSTWYHTLGCDWGYYPDPCTWVVIASHPNEKTVYAVHAEKHLGMTQEKAAEVTARIVAEFKPSRAVADHNGGYIETYNTRYAGPVPLELADKLGKRDAIDVMNTELLAGRFKVVLDTAGELAAEMQSLPWKDEHRLVEKPSVPNDLCDAALYAFKSHYAWAHQEEALHRDPLPGTDAYQAWFLEKDAEAWRAQHERPWWDRP